MKKIALILGLSVAVTAFSGQVMGNTHSNTLPTAAAAAAAAVSNNPYYVAGIDSSEEFTTYFSKLQQAVKDGDSKSVADLISYPLRVNKSGKSFMIHSKEQFVQKYNRIITTEVKEKLLAQKADNVFVNWKGIMVGDGELWIGKIDNKLGVIAVNLIDNPYAAAGITNPTAFNHFLSKLQKDVAAGNKAEVADSIAYPLRVNHNGKSLEIKTKKQFIANYDSIMTAAVKKKLLAQKADKVTVSWKGVMVGGGELWIGQFGERIGVFAVNR
ncbi:hypothetical protein [Paenibacillus sp. NPDC058071]|uniref:hypothetical protein n=1 Tax=Paenibacillus sp. NPDC058071 TaxID=3346326 RepID=UPI0036DF6E68